MVKNVVLKRWNLDGEVEIALDDDMFYFIFNNEQDGVNVIEEGSFFIAGFELLNKCNRKAYMLGQGHKEEDHGQFVRVCVDVIAKKSLLTEIKAEISGNKVANIAVSLPMEIKPLIYTICAMFSHTNESCGKPMHHQGKPLGSKHHNEQKRWSKVNSSWTTIPQQKIGAVEPQARGIVEAQAHKGSEMDIQWQGELDRAI
ncbi:hypothetical protein FRX31_029284, partial [Thalictrum thalictroides]